MANIFDQFNEPTNVFDQFDELKDKSFLPDFVTGRGAESEVTKGLPELQDSGILSGESMMRGAAITPALLTTTDPNEIADIIKSNFPNIGVTYNKGPDGNVYPILNNNETGAKAVINRPGMSGLDVMQGLGLAAAYTPAGKAASVVGAAGKSALTGAAIEGSQSAIGGEFNIKNVGMDAAFGAGGKAVENLVSSAYRAIKGKPSEPVKDLTEFAESQGLPLSTTDVVPPETFAGRAAQALGEKIPFVGTGKMQASKQESRIKLLDDLGKKYGVPTESEIFESFIRKSDATKQAAGNRYNKITEQMGGDPISITKTVDAFDNAIAKLMQKGKFKDTETASKLMSLKNELLEAPQSFQTLKENRTLFRENVRGDRMNFPSTSDRIVNDIYKDITENLRVEVGKRLGDKESQRWIKANQYLFNEAEILKKTRLKNILNKGGVTPEVAQQIVFSKNPSEVRALFARLDKEGRDAGRAALISKALEKSNGSPERFLTNMKAMEKQTDIFFRGKEKQFIKGVLNYLEATKEASQAAVRTKTGQEMLAPLIVGGGAADLLTGGGAATASVGAYGLMARMYESQVAKNLMVKLANTKKGTLKYDKLLQDISPYVIGLSQSLKERKQ